ncbi:MAG: hypothetical protein JW825_02485 [Candidatus Methanofastidiosa archaeon]|nr:hypothetical protein [Candidatus Methanofastidiosa archaeon]
MRRIAAFLALSLLIFSMVSLIAADIEGTYIGEDLLIAGGTVYIDEPISGDVIAFAGTIYVNAPIEGDLIAFAGKIEVNGEIGGKIIVAGGNVDIFSDVYKILAAGGNVNIHRGAMVSTNAYIAAPDVDNAGIVYGELRVFSRNFENTGSAGNLEVYEMDGFGEFGLGMHGFLSLIYLIRIIIGILVTIGFAILGMLLLKTFKRQFLAIEGEIRSSPIIVTVLGFVFGIASVIVFVIFLITMVGIPFAIMLCAIMTIAFILSFLVVSLALGRKVGQMAKWQATNTWYFVVGLIIVRVLTWLPIIGLFFIVLFLSMGIGGLFYAVKNNWHTIAQRE